MRVAAVGNRRHCLALVLLTVAVAIAGAAGAAASSAPESCGVGSLSPEQRAAGDRAARRYAAERKREFRHDLMGYRRGRKLPRADRKERREIKETRRARLTFALNPAQRLIRRLLRDHSKAVDDSIDELGFPLTRVEVRTVRFEEKLQDSTGRVDDYAARCARGDDGGAYFSSHPRRPQLFVVNVTRDVDGYRDEYRERFRYGSLLRVRRVRFSLDELNRVYDRVAADGDRHGWFDRHKLHLSEVSLDEERNAVVIGLTNPSRRAKRLLRHRYGAAVWMDPHRVRVVALR